MYKLVVLSDVHHDIDKVRKILPIINSADCLIFCGDGLNEMMSIRGEITVPTVFVKGNNDWQTKIAEMSSITLGETRALVVHGHRHGVRHGVDGLIAAARLKNCRLVFFGHTHTPYDAVCEGIHIINPGAISGFGSYALVVGDGKNFTCKHETIYR